MSIQMVNLLWIRLDNNKCYSAVHPEIWSLLVTQNGKAWCWHCGVSGVVIGVLQYIYLFLTKEFHYVFWCGSPIAVVYGYSCGFKWLAWTLTKSIHLLPHNYQHTSGWEISICDVANSFPPLNIGMLFDNRVNRSSFAWGFLCNCYSNVGLTESLHVGHWNPLVSSEKWAALNCIAPSKTSKPIEIVWIVTHLLLHWETCLPTMMR